MKTKTFFNTINLSGERLQKAIARALAQEELIKEIFYANPDKKFSPSQIQKIFSSKFDRNVPITSIRRAITNLSTDRYATVLQKTDEQVPGSYGLPEHLWRLRPIASDKDIDKFWQEYEKEPPNLGVPEVKTSTQTNLFDNGTSVN